MKINHHIHSFTLAAAVAIGLAACPALSHAQDLITNGSFENPLEATNSLTEITATGIPGWTGDSIAGKTHEYIINGNIEDLSGNNYGTTPYGQQYLGLNAIYANSFHSIETQVVNGVTIGQTYALTIDIANLDGASDPKVLLTVEPNSTSTGTPLASATFTAPVEGPYGSGTIDFVPETLIFTATSNVVSLNINNSSKTGVMGIDSVSLVAVPEPTTAAGMLLGAAGLVAVLARRRLQQS